LTYTKDGLEARGKTMRADHNGYAIQIMARRVPSDPARWYVYATIYPRGIKATVADE
jgi:hypothetical protein